MKKLLTLILLILSISAVQASFVRNMPTIRIQPNGDTLHCLVTGDEFYHRLHDQQGYTIIQNTDGYYVYAEMLSGELVPTAYIAGIHNPVGNISRAELMPSQEELARLHKRLDIPQQYRPSGLAIKNASTNHGVLNNIVIFIRFSDENEISTSFSTINSMFNDSTPNAISMYNYFKRASYNQLYIPTYFYPTPSGNQVISYQDSLPRSYYQPYNATSCPNGYQTDSERASREFGLLERAVNFVNENYPIPTSINIDKDNDGYVDNICFVVKGTYTGWSDLLWPHKWGLYDRNVYINNKRVYTFNLQLEGSGSHYFSSSTFCHEMFHTLGAPDLYHYNAYGFLHPAGSWDLMEQNSTPPQHMSSYMKYRYGYWIDSIPEITHSGTYELHSLGDTSNFNNCYKIQSQNPFQYYVLEYRDNSELFETALPGSGLLIWRVDTRENGGASFDRENYFDELYLFRPGGIDDTTNGTPAQAYFSQQSGRTSFNPTTDPYPFLTLNEIDTTISISNIGTSGGTTISFTYNDLRGCVAPLNLRVTDVNNTQAHVEWSGRVWSYQLKLTNLNDSSVVLFNVDSTENFILSSLVPSTPYELRIASVCDENELSDFGDPLFFNTTRCAEPLTDSIGESASTSYRIPVNTYYNYSFTQMIYTNEELGNEEKEISSISFYYTHESPCSSKTNCTIYIGHTLKDQFNSSSDHVDLDSSRMVYTGDMICHQGWNEFKFTEPFLYDGIRNLCISIDDNSGQYNSSTFTFSCANTTTNRAITYFSDSYNPDPENLDNFSGSHSRYDQLPILKIHYCLQPDYAHVTVLSENEEMGTASAMADSLEIGSEATVIAHANYGYHFAFWTNGNSSDNSTDMISTDNPFNFILDQDTVLLAVFEPDTFAVELHYALAPGSLGNPEDTLINCLQGEGYYPYLSEVTITFLDNMEDYGISFAGWSDGEINATRTFTLSCDTSFTALILTICIGINNIQDEQIVLISQGLNIQFTGVKETKQELTISDVLGRIIYSSKECHDGQILTMPHAGIYLVKIGNRKVQKIYLR